MGDFTIVYQTLIKTFVVEEKPKTGLYLKRQQSDEK